MTEPEQAEPFNRYGPFLVHSPEWHAHRRLSIGASEVASILGAPGAFATPLQVWAEKRDMIVDTGEDDQETEDFLHFGLVMEPVIAEEFVARAGYPIEDEDQQFISQLYPYLGCSLDKWTWISKARGPLELKNTHFFMKGDWDNEPPLKYQIQVQAQIAVTGADVGAIAVLIGGNLFKWAIVERNQRFIDAMLEKVERFWEMVRNDEMPEAIAKDNRFIGQLLGEEKEGTTIILDGKFFDVEGELNEIKEEQKRLQKRRDALEAKIKQAIGKAERGVLPDGSSFTFKTQKREPFAVPAAEYRVLRRTK